MTGAFNEVSDRVWVSRREWLDTTAVVIAGQDGVLLVDTHGSTRAGQALVDDVRALGIGEVTGVVNTHWHFDHTFGNRAVLDAYGPVPVYAHEDACAELEEFGPAALATRAVPGHPESDGHHHDVAETQIVLPTHSFSAVQILDLGDRQVELVHPGRGHTSGDIVVNVPDAGVLIAGDLVEQSGAPCFGEDSWPLEWPLALDFVLGMLRPETVVIPGHGAVVDLPYVQEQRGAIGVVAETIRDLAGRGVRLEDALGAAQWPYLPESLAHAVTRGYQHLPRSQKRLPLI